MSISCFHVHNSCHKSASSHYVQGLNKLVFLQIVFAEFQPGTDSFDVLITFIECSSSYTLFLRGISCRAVAMLLV